MIAPREKALKRGKNQKNQKKIKKTFQKIWKYKK